MQQYVHYYIIFLNNDILQRTLILQTDFELIDIEMLFRHNTENGLLIKLRKYKIIPIIIIWLLIIYYIYSIKTENIHLWKEHNRTSIINISKLSQVFIFHNKNRKVTQIMIYNLLIISIYYLRVKYNFWSNNIIWFITFITFLNKIRLKNKTQIQRVYFYGNFDGLTFYSFILRWRFLEIFFIFNNWETKYSTWKLWKCSNCWRYFTCWYTMKGRGGDGFIPIGCSKPKVPIGKYSGSSEWYWHIVEFRTGYRRLHVTHDKKWHSDHARQYVFFQLPHSAARERIYSVRSSFSHLKINEYDF